MIIAVDGPAGAGKGTICSLVAKHLNLTNYCSGEIYRLCAYILTHPELGIWITHPSQISNAINEGKIKYKWNNLTNESEVWLGEKNIKPLLHQNNISKQTSLISAQYPEAITEIVQKIGSKIVGNIICEGRNVGSHIFPNSHLKFYIDARPEIRARRRHLDLTKKGILINLETVLQEIIDRDKMDMSRSFAPLRRLNDAIYIDTSDQSSEESMKALLKIIQPQLNIQLPNVITD
jgi:cytidylate kinase